MTVLQSLLLGILQGIAEFLPISSSAHLIIFPYLLGWKESGLAFDVALHLGTLIAILIFFYKDWINLIKGGFKKVFKKEEKKDYKNLTFKIKIVII